MTRTTIRSEDITAGQVKSADLASDAVTVTTVSASAPGSPSQGDWWHDSTNRILKYYDGTTWWSIKTFQNGADSASAVTSSTPITSLLEARGESDGSITAGVYWFKNGQGGTYTFPAYLDNYDNKTWMLMQKNFVPHAYITGDSVHSDDHAYSYGLMDSSGNAIITSNLTSDSPSSSTLGVNHARVYIDSVEPRAIACR